MSLPAHVSCLQPIERRLSCSARRIFASRRTAAITNRSLRHIGDNQQGSRGRNEGETSCYMIGHL